MARKFVPNLKFKVNTWIMFPVVQRWEGITSKTRRAIGKIKHVNIYNRNDVKYVIFSDNKYVEVHKDIIDKEAIAGDPETLEVLFGPSR